jgi:hypothetical protein
MSEMKVKFISDAPGNPCPVCKEPTYFAEVVHPVYLDKTRYLDRVWPIVLRAGYVTDSHFHLCKNWASCIWMEQLIQ